MNIQYVAKRVVRAALGDAFSPVKGAVQRGLFGLGIWRLPTPVRLHLGCGPRHLDGYVNIDLLSGVADILADCTRLPFIKSGTASHILVEHMLEHLSRAGAQAALQEWARLLAPGGVLEVEVPDVIWCIEHFLSSTEAERYQSQYEGKGAIAALFGLQTNPGQFHRFGYTPDHLMSCLRAVGLDVIDVKLYMTPHPCRSIRVYARKPGPHCAPPDGRE